MPSDTSAMLTVALDVTPLVGPRTGIGHFVASIWDALVGLGGGPAVRPYVVSRRADLAGLPAGTVRLPVPAEVAVRVWSRARLPIFAGRLRADVVHGTNFVAPPDRRRPVVVTVHDCAFARVPDLSPPAAHRYGRAARAAVRAGAWVHTPTEAVARDVRELFDTDRVRVIHHGVPHLPDPSPETVPVEKPYLLSLGTLEARKRPERVVEAFSLLAADRPDLRLVMAGTRGRATRSVEAAVAHLPTDQRTRVRLLGHVSDRTRSALLRGADVVVSASAYEGFSLPVAEALATGSPVVSTRAGGAVEEVGGEAVGIVDDDAASIATGIAEVLSDADRRARLVDAGRVRAEQFSWADAAAQMAALYADAYADHHAGPAGGAGRGARGG